MAQPEFWVLRSSWLSRLAPAVAGAAICVAGCGSDAVGSDPILITFSTQPTNVVAGTPITPPVIIEVSSDARQTVTLAIPDNYCGATIAGQTSHQTVNRIASFPDLSLDIPIEDVRLEARVLDGTVLSAPFDVQAADPGTPFVQHPTLCLNKSLPSDAATLAWVARDDVLWTADDTRDLICGVDRRSGTCIEEVTEADLLAAFPAAGDCDDGDADALTSCSYTDELEAVAFDDRDGRLYVFNTVNDPTQFEDAPAVFRFRLGSCRACLLPDGWNALPRGFDYSSAVAVDGELFIADGMDLRPYDFDENRVGEAIIPRLVSSGVITDLAFRQNMLYVMTSTRRLIVAEREEFGELTSYDLTPIGVRTPGGIEVIRDTLLVLEGDARNPVFVVTLAPSTF